MKDEIEFVRAVPKLLGKELVMSSEENVRVMREIFSAIERRDAQRVLDLCDPNVEFHWPPSLPYGGITYGRDQEGPFMGQDVGPSATNRGRATDGSTRSRRER